MDPQRLSHKTREALGRGSVALWGNFKQHRSKPRLHIPAAGATVTAVSDYTETLRDRQCYIVTGGEVLVGEVVKNTVLEGIVLKKMQFWKV